VELDEIFVISNVTVSIVPIICQFSVERGTDKMQNKTKTKTKTNKQTNLEFWELFYKLKCNIYRLKCEFYRLKCEK
jgi:hypothetical protein